MNILDDKPYRDNNHEGGQPPFDDVTSGGELTYKEKRRKAAKEKRQKDQMSVTIFGIIIYSVVLIMVVVFSYVGFRSGITRLRTEKEAAQEERRLQEEKELKEKLEKEKQEAEAEAAAAAAEEDKTEEEETDGYEDLVFSVIENVSNPGSAPVNSYNFSRRSLSDDTGKLMDYEIYTNPETLEIAKVTTRENCGDLFEITDYYYYEGKINYIAQYREDTDVPIDISTDKVESRYYFNNDKMVRYIYSENNRAVEYTLEDFGLYSDGTIGQYEYMEDMMLESSKTVFKNAGSLEENVVISGYVLDEINCPVKEHARLQLLDRNGRIVKETETNDDGYYEITVKPDSAIEYHLAVSGREDMISTTVWGIKAPVGTKNVDVETVYLAYEVYDTIYPVQIFALDADATNSPLKGADIRFRYGINTREGDTCLTGVLGDAGEIMPSLRSGSYTAEISKNGYETVYVPFTVKSDHTAVVAYSVKSVTDGIYKCVLSYETTPLDLDLKCFDTYGRNVSKSATDSVGITTAEVISLNNADTGTYTFYVSDFSEIAGSDMTSYKLSQSNAKLYVYNSDGLYTVLSVPPAHAGVVWRAFEVRNRQVMPVNDYYVYIVDDSIFRHK